MKRLIITTLLIIFTIMGSVVFAANKSGDIYLGGYMLLRIRVGSSEMTKSERIKLVQERAATLVSCAPENTKIRIVKRHDDNVILVHNMLFITVGKEDAIANRTTIDKLTNDWVNSIRTILPKASPRCKTVI